MLLADLVHAVARGAGRLLLELLGEQLAAERVAVARVGRLDEVAHHLLGVVAVVVTTAAGRQGERERTDAEEQGRAGHAATCS